MNNHKICILKFLIPQVVEPAHPPININSKKNTNEIKHAFAILPKDGDKKEKISYEASQTKKMVHIKRIDVNDCVEKIKRDDERGLREIVNSLIQE